MIKIIEKLNPKSILDVGCGHGFFVGFYKMYYPDIRVIGIDGADAILTEKVSNDIFYGDANMIPFEDKSFDLVMSSDFFEHIKEEEIDRIYSEMKRVGERMLSFIAVENKELTDKQLQYHCTNKPLEWWKKKLPEMIIYDSRILGGKI